MRFINKGEPIKIRLEKEKRYYWITLKKGEAIELDEAVGIANGLTEIKLTKGEINNKKIETKQIDYTPDDLFFKELRSIKEIGNKTAKDIVTWGTREKLIEEIKNKKTLPFRDDISKLLEEKYGQVM